MGMKQTRWVAAKQTDVKQIIGKRQLDGKAELIMKIEDSVSILAKKYTGSIKDFNPADMGYMLESTQPNYDGACPGMPSDLIIVVTGDVNGTYADKLMPITKPSGNMVSEISDWLMASPDREAIEPWYIYRDEKDSENIRLDVFYLYREPASGIPTYVADQLYDPDSWYGADAVRYAMDELFTRCVLFRINNEVPTYYEFISSDAQGALFYRHKNLASFENLDPTKKHKKVRIKWDDIESVIPA